MKIAFLIRGSDIKDQLRNIALPEGVSRTIGTYQAEGGNLFFIHFSMDGNTLANARVLVKFRDILPNSGNVRILRDEASAKFCELLYPHFCRFEKSLREAITIATCAVQGNFDDKRVVEMEEQFILEALYEVLFFDSKFVREAKNYARNKTFTREQLKTALDALEEQILWNILFSDDDMPTFRERHLELKDRRNDVMHYHKMPEATFDDTRALLKKVNSEIDEYLDGIRSDVTYPKAKAQSAKVAAQLINENYADMLEGIRSSLGASGLLNLGDSYSEIARMAADSLDTSGFASIAQQVADSICLASQLLSNQALAAMTPTPGITEVIEAMHPSIGDTLAGYAKDISAYYNQIVPRETLDAIGLACTSIGFTAGLNLGSSLSHTSTAADDMSNSDAGDTEKDVDHGSSIRPKNDDE